MSSSQGDYNYPGMDAKYSLGKGEQRHLEKVSRARAQAAEQKVSSPPSSSLSLGLAKAHSSTNR